MSKIDMTYLSKLTVPEKLELLSLASTLKSSVVSEKEKVATLLSIFIDSEEMAKLISNNFAGKEYGKKDFFDKLLNDAEFYNAFQTPNAINFVSQIQEGVDEFLETLDLEKDLNFEYLTADEKQVSVINPFKGINGESGNTENFKYFFDDAVKVEDFNKSRLPKVLKGFKTAVAYDGTNKRGRIFYRSDKARSLDYKKSTKKFALIKNLYYLVARKEKDALETRNIFVNNIRNRRLQVKRVRKAIGKLAVNSKLTIDDQDKRRYKMESSVERISNFIYDNILYSLMKNKKFTKATNNHFNSIFSIQYSFEEYQNIKLIACLLATKYIIQYVDFDKYATVGTNQALQSKLDNTIGKVCREVGYDEKMFVPAHIIAKKLCKDFFKYNKESFANIATVYTDKKIDDNLVSLDDAMFRTVYDPNDVGIYLQQKNIENNPEDEPFKDEEMNEDEDNVQDETITEDTDDLEIEEIVEDDFNDANIDVEQVEPIDIEEDEEKEEIAEESNALCTPLFMKLYVINSKEKILARLRELDEKNDPNSKETQDNEEEIDNDEVIVEEKTYLSFISEADLVKTFSNVKQEETKLDAIEEPAKPANTILIPEKIKTFEQNEKEKISSEEDASTLSTTQDKIQKLTKFDFEKFNTDEASVNIADVKEALYSMISNLSNKMIIGLETLASVIDNTINQEQATKDMHRILKNAYTAFKQSRSNKEMINKLADTGNPYFELYDYAYDYIHAIEAKYGQESDYAGKISEALEKEILDRFNDNLNEKFDRITEQAHKNCLFRVGVNRGRYIKQILLNLIRYQMKEIYFDLGKLSAEEKIKINTTRYKNTRDALFRVCNATNTLIDNHEDLRFNEGASYDIQLLDCAKSIKDEIAKQINNNPRLEINETRLIDIYAKTIKNRLNTYIKNHLLSDKNQDFSPIGE